MLSIHVNGLLRHTGVYKLRQPPDGSRYVQVFSQWKDALLVVSKALSAHSIGHVSLTGGRQGKVGVHPCQRLQHNLEWMHEF